jgi:predicted aldo/keto reductase-like oxidoreductase
MIYQTLGRTGLQVSQLGFGAMRLPMVGEGESAYVNRDLAIPLIHRAFELGVNYIDTAVFYCNRDSQRAVGEALKGWRDRIIVSTKNHYYDEDESAWWKNLEDSLERLQVEYIDIYNHHGISWQAYVEKVEPRVATWMQRAKAQGLIKHICTSFHDTNDGLMKLVDSGYPDVITLQYNMLDRQLEEGIAHAHAHGIGIVAMGPVAGGNLGATSEVLNTLIPNITRVPELALRFVLGNPHVSVALSGMSAIEQVEENAAVASDPTPLSEADQAAIDEHLTRMREMAKLYCSGCDYCQPCPAEVKISFIFQAYNLGRVYGLWDVARKHYRAIGTVPWLQGTRADACTACGACEEKCPQRLAIRAQLQEAHEALKDA